MIKMLLTVFALIIAQTSFLLSMAIADAEVVELQWAVCGQSADEVSRLFAQSSRIQAQAKSGHLEFLDTQDYSLYRSNVSVKVEEFSGEYKVSVKINYDPTKIQRVQFATAFKKLKCEWDRYPSYTKYACKLTHKIDNLNDGLFSAEQIQFVESEKGIHLANIPLRAVGGWFNFQKRDLNFADKDFNEFSVDNLFSGAGPITEISVRTDTDSALGAENQMLNLIRQARVQLCPQQKGKFARLIGG